MVLMQMLRELRVFDLDAAVRDAQWQKTAADMGRELGMDIWVSNEDGMVSVWIAGSAEDAARVLVAVSDAGHVDKTIAVSYEREDEYEALEQAAGEQVGDGGELTHELPLPEWDRV